MSSDYQGTITRLLANLKAGGIETKQEAMQGLWNAYFERLLQVARTVLSDRAKRVNDEEDVVGSVFLRLWSKAHHGTIPDIRNRGELWGLLLKITREKSIDRTRYAARQKRGGDRTEEDHVKELVSQEPTPEFVASLNDEFQRLLKRLGDAKLQQVVLLKLEGRTTQEIAAVFGISERTIQRKLSLICSEWEKELEVESDTSGTTLM